MPEQLVPLSFRCTTEEVSLVEKLGVALAQPGARPLSRSDVVRTAIVNLAQVKLPAPAQVPVKKSRKKA